MKEKWDFIRLYIKNGVKFDLDKLVHQSWLGMPCQVGSTNVQIWQGCGHDISSHYNVDLQDP